MNVVNITYTYKIDDVQRQIIEHLVQHQDIVFVINTGIPLKERKDVSNQFYLKDMAKLHGLKIIDCDFFECERMVFREKYVLSNLGNKIAEELNR